MRLLSYNCCGLGSKRAVRALKSLLRRASPQVVFLMETKQAKAENEETQKELGFAGGDSWPTDTSRGGRAEGLCVWWKEEVELTVMHASSHCMDLKIVGEGGEIWRFTGIYGWPGSGQKHNTWDLIRGLARQWEGPWLCGGDFNEILSGEEKRCGQVREENDIEAFQECLVEGDLRDLGFHGYQYTWENRRRNGGYVEERLDRFVATEEWAIRFNKCKVRHMDKTRSDHRPIICDTEGDDDDDEPRWGWSFRYDPFWSKHEDSKRVVKEAWGGGGALSAMDKISQCRAKLELFNIPQLC
ncbi:unnamed protein product [Linum trigynum]|uniref:Endonuclease/exonuclease/phosphatase domain-containing protein n=1 Tax=Linum trigynum TaxID=586398 RepID=A0AAV2CBP3_9ROSI